jgi:hypothetical protein
MTNKIDYNKSQFSLFLPWPIEFNSLRKVDATMVIHPGIDAQWFPLALALRYKVPPLPKTPIPGCNWRGDQNFHIFAEPECKLTCPQAMQHGPEMVAQLLDMFVPPAAFSLSQPRGSECRETPPDTCSTAPGVKPGEDNCLGELFPCPRPTGPLELLNVHLPLCASILVTPT